MAIIDANEINLESGKSYLDKGGKTLDKESLFKSKIIFDALIDGTPRNYLYYYYSAQTHSNFVNLYEIQADKEMALKSIEAGIKGAKKSVRLNTQFSDSHRLLGELYGRIIDYKGGFSGAIYGPRAKKELLKALKLNPQNPRAYIGLGIWKLKAPEFFGGNIEGAIKNLKEAIQISPDIYEAYVWLGIAYKKKGKIDEAKMVLEKALVISPNNDWVKSELSKLSSTQQGKV
jgi:tetratricopeptide (TPR) repeat protein